MVADDITPAGGQTLVRALDILDCLARANAWAVGARDQRARRAQAHDHVPTREDPRLAWLPGLERAAQVPPRWRGGAARRGRDRAQRWVRPACRSSARAVAATSSARPSACTRSPPASGCACSSSSAASRSGWNPASAGSTPCTAAPPARRCWRSNPVPSKALIDAAKGRPLRGSGGRHRDRHRSARQGTRGHPVSAGMPRATRRSSSAPPHLPCR